MKRKQLDFTVLLRWVSSVLLARSACPIMRPHHVHSWCHAKGIHLHERAPLWLSDGSPARYSLARATTSEPDRSLAALQFLAHKATVTTTMS